jgi:hypothetical protein
MTNNPGYKFITVVRNPGGGGQIRFQRLNNGTYQFEIGTSYAATVSRDEIFFDNDSKIFEYKHTNKQRQLDIHMIAEFDERTQEVYGNRDDYIPKQLCRWHLCNSHPFTNAPDRGYAPILAKRIYEYIDHIKWKPYIERRMTIYIYDIDYICSPHSWLKNLIEMNQQSKFLSKIVDSYTDSPELIVSSNLIDI